MVVPKKVKQNKTEGGKMKKGEVVSKRKRMNGWIEEMDDRQLKTFIEFYLGAMSRNVLKDLAHVIIEEIIDWETR